MKNFVSNGRFFVIVSIFLAGLCLLRVFTVRADDELDDQESEEVYQLQGSTSTRGWDNSRSINDSIQGDVRLSRPDEAALRIVEDDKNRAVPGIERIRNYEQSVAGVQVPVKTGRTIASIPDDAAPKPGKLAAGQSLKTPQGMSANSENAPSQRSSYAAVEEDEVQTPRRAGPGYEGPAALATLSVAPMEPKPAVATLSQEVSLIVNETGYYPSRIFATAHVPLRIFISTPSKSTQCFMLDSWGVRKGVAPGRVEEVSFTPDRPGTYRFYCPVKAVEGTLVVREAPDESVINRRFSSQPTSAPSMAANQGRDSQRHSARADASFSEEEFQQAFRSPAEAKEVESPQAAAKVENPNEPKNADELRKEIIED